MSSISETATSSNVGLCLATSFKECVAMDLKFYKGHILSHLVDHAACLSASTETKLKDQNVIIEAIYCIWIQVHAPRETLSDKREEFANQDFLDMSEVVNIHLRTTATESAFSNGAIECHNLILRC